MAKRRHNCDQNFSFGVQCVNRLFLKNDGYAQRLCEFGKAEYVKEEKPVKAEVVVTDKVPEIKKPAEEAPKSAKPKKK